MLRSAFLALCAVLLSPAATAQDFVFSPDGQHLGWYAVQPGSLDPPVLTKSRLQIFSVSCLIGGKSLDDCVEKTSNTTVYAGRRPTWSSDSQRLLSASGPRVILGVDGSEGKLDFSGSIEPRIFENGDNAFLNPPKVRSSPVPSSTMSIVNGRGESVGYYDYEEPAAHNLTGQSFKLSLHASESMIGDRYTKRRQIIPQVSGSTFWLWSDTSGARGALVEFAPDLVRELALPPRIRGPVRLAVDDTTGEPIALYDAFAIHPLERAGNALDWLVKSVEALRAESQPALVFVTLSTAGKVAVVRTAPTLSCNENWLITPNLATRISPACEVTPKAASYAVSYADLPGPFPLAARLYRSHASEAANRNLIIFLHGGPLVNSFSDPMMDNLYDDGRFDILSLEYRGSSGLGQAYAEALKPPVGDIAAEDLRLAIEWARNQPEYRKGLVGAWGSSWGGLAVHAVLSRDASGIDFLMSDTGFVERGPEAIQEICANERPSWANYIHGLWPDATGQCAMHWSGVLGRKVTSKVPIMLITAERDKPGAYQREKQWAGAARRDGGCISVIESKKGSHAGSEWPQESKDRLRELLRQWIDNVAAKHPARCSTNVELP